jgi:hypothetical protein
MLCWPLLQPAWTLGCGADGLAWALEGAAVVNLTAAATLSDGRVSGGATDVHWYELAALFEETAPTVTE